ncbi:unnamed protein product [Microthlaspi erraticum]|uniref:Cullin N-terminal domain-containing protein n=1 Tax=Microthlaspi erraticum TaxID=1685480 RepID=A0A6D2J8V3_9BRAS|nr:unnamed protein product [Microthlaspi erraticum]
MERKTIDFDQGWEYIHSGITKKNRYLEGLGPAPGPEEYMELYTTVYNMSPRNLLMITHGRFMTSIVKQLRNMNFICRRSLPTVEEVGLTCFSDLVYNNLQRKVKEAVITLVDRERDGEDIDRELVKSVVEFYVEIGMGKMERYEQDFERFLLEECLKKEKERVTHYLPSSSVPKLVKKVEHDLLVKYANQLQLLQQSEFCEMARGLEHIENIFKKYVTDAERTDLLSRDPEPTCFD